MLMGAVPDELLVLAIVGLAGFGLGWWLRRNRQVQEMEAVESQGPTAIVPLAFNAVPTDERVGREAPPAAEPMGKEAAATLAAASQVMQYRHQLPHCPNCASEMELRIFGEKRIWICEAFPACRGAQMAE